MQRLTTPQRYCADGVRVFAKRAVVVGNEITNIYVHEFMVEDEGRSGRQFRELTGRGEIPCGNNGYEAASYFSAGIDGRNL